MVSTATKKWLDLYPYGLKLQQWEAQDGEFYPVVFGPYARVFQGEI